MAKLIVSLEGVVIKEVRVTKDKTMIGRRPYNDVVIDNLAVSGEHAMVLAVGSEFFVEDCNSTNGTYLNGRPVKREALTHGDTFEIGKYKVAFLDNETPDFDKTVLGRPPEAAASSPLFGRTGFGDLSSEPPRASTLSDFGVSQPIGPASAASVKVLNGSAIGREVPLTKVVTTVGKPGVQVASITKRPGGYVFAHVEGGARPTVNGQPVGGDPVALKSGDIIELAGTQMQFLQA